MNLKLDKAIYIGEFDHLCKTTDDVGKFIYYIRETKNIKHPINTTNEDVLINIDEQKAWRIRLSKIYDFKNFDPKEQKELEKNIALNKLTNREKQLLGLKDK